MGPGPPVVSAWLVSAKKSLVNESDTLPGLWIGEDDGSVSGLRTDIGRGGSGVSDTVFEEDRSISGWIATFSLRQPDISAARFGFDAGVLWNFVFCSVDGGGFFGESFKEASGY